MIAALSAASRDLLYTSESDAPFETIRWPSRAMALAPDDVLKLVGKPAGTPIVERSLADFFQDLTRDEDWHDAEARATVERYRRLQRIFSDRLSSARVYDVGEVNVDVYLVGRSPASEWIGLKTAAVET